MSKLSNNSLVLIIVALIIAGGAIAIIALNNQDDGVVGNNNTSVQNQNGNSNENVNNSPGNLTNEGITGTIEGSLSYPSEEIPADMIVCADNTATQKVYCTDQISDNKYVYGKGYRLALPEGTYHVYATLSSLPAYKQYYTQAVVCGMEVECMSHELIVVKVTAGQSVNNIDPFDFEWDKAVSSDLIDYQSPTGNFMISYPPTWQFVQDFKITKGSSTLEVYILEKQTGDSLSEWLSCRDQNLDVQVLSEENVTINGLSGVKRTTATMGDANNPSFDVYLDNSNKVYEIGGIADSETQSEVNQITDSFQLL